MIVFVFVFLVLNANTFIVEAFTISLFVKPFSVSLVGTTHGKCGIYQPVGVRSVGKLSLLAGRLGFLTKGYTLIDT